MSTPPFDVLLGPDHAGKSTAVAALRGSGHPVRLISADDSHLDARHRLVATVRHGIIGDVGEGLGRHWSPDFLVALAQAVIVHLRDEVLRARPGLPLLVDSYYYKTLAKCRLAGSGEHPVFGWWRTFPQPRRVVYLAVDPETAWERAGHGTGSHPLECDGPVDRDHFATYQRELDDLMRAEVAALPITEIDGRGSPAATADALREVLDQ